MIKSNLDNAIPENGDDVETGVTGDEDYKWAEFNLPAMLVRMALASEDDDLAFVAVGLEAQLEPGGGG